MKKLPSIILLTLLLSFSLSADGLKTYEVSITNATAGHVFTPTFLVTHAGKFSLFNVGQPALAWCFKLKMVTPGIYWQKHRGYPVSMTPWWKNLYLAISAHRTLTGTIPVLASLSPVSTRTTTITMTTTRSSR